MPRKLLNLPARLPNSVKVHHAQIKQYGYWDERHGEIVIASDLPPAGELVILIHEALHMAESTLKQHGLIQRRTGEKFVQNAAPIVAATLVACGPVPRVTLRHLRKLKERQR